MVKKSGVVILALAVTIFSVYFIGFASADVFLSTQPNNNYNLGDTMSVVLGSDGVQGWAGVDLVCSNQTKQLYFHYTDDTSSATINAPLTKDFLRGMIGTCNLRVSFNGLSKDSFSFIISDHIDSNINFNGKSFKPGDNIIFSGTVSKPDNNPVAGSVNVKFDGLSLEALVPVTNNQFSGNITIPDNVAAGTYNVEVSVSEKDVNGEITNTGSLTGNSISILQKPTKLTLTADQDVNPGNELSFSSVLYDQTGGTIDKDSVAYVLLDVNGKEMFNKLATTGDKNYINLESDAPYGYWNLSATAEGITQYAQSYVEKNREAVFDLVNGSLFVRNVGNVAYDKSIEVKIGNETKVLNLNLSVGSSAKFPLNAPDGTYDVAVSDGNYSQSYPGVYLTGRAISVDGSGGKSSFNLFANNWLLWVFVIAILGLFIFLSSRKIMNKNVFLNAKDSNKGYTNIKDKEEEKKGGVVKVTPGVDNKPVFEPETGVAVYSSVIDGTRQNVAFMAVKLKNYSQIKDNKTLSDETIKKVTNEINSGSGKVYRNDDFIFGIFTPNPAKNNDINMAAIKTSKLVSKILKEHNSKFSQKINFGIGVNNGDIIAKKQSGKLFFNPLGSTMATAKRIAEIASDSILLSEDIHKKVMSQVKTSMNQDSSGFRTYLINDIVDRESNTQFIQSFLQRNQDFKTLREFKAGSSVNKPQVDVKPSEEKKGFNLDEWKK